MIYEKDAVPEQERDTLTISIQNRLVMPMESKSITVRGVKLRELYSLINKAIDYHLWSGGIEPKIKHKRSPKKKGQKGLSIEEFRSLSVETLEEGYLIGGAIQYLLEEGQNISKNNKEHLEKNLAQLISPNIMFFVLMNILAKNNNTIVNEKTFNKKYFELVDVSPKDFDEDFNPFNWLNKGVTYAKRITSMNEFNPLKEYILIEPFIVRSKKNRKFVVALMKDFFEDIKSIFNEVISNDGTE